MQDCLKLAAAACAQTMQLAGSLEEQMQTQLLLHRGLLVVQQEHAANLSSAIRAQDLDAAKLAYLRLRPYYEQIEVRLCSAFSWSAL